jgi:hypothetical protein
MEASFAIVFAGFFSIAKLSLEGKKSQISLFPDSDFLTQIADFTFSVGRRYQQFSPASLTHPPQCVALPHTDDTDKSD